MIVALEGRYTRCIKGTLLEVGDTLEKWQAFGERCVLQIGGFCHERVADGRRLREKGWGPRVRSCLAGHFPALR